MASGEMTSGEYIEHHLSNLTYGRMPDGHMAVCGKPRRSGRDGVLGDPCRLVRLVARTRSRVSTGFLASSRVERRPEFQECFSARLR